MQKWASGQEVWIGRTLQRCPNRSEGLRWQDLVAQSRQILGWEGEGVRRDSTEEIEYQQQDRLRVPRHTSNAVEKGGKFARIKQAVSSLLSEFHPIPLNHIMKILPEDHVRYDLSLVNPVNEKYFERACELYQQNINRMSLKQLKDLYKEGKPIFYANNIDPFQEYYHDRETSVKYLVQLLKYQYGDSDEKIKELLTNIVSWFNRKGWYLRDKDGKYSLNPKINCVAINGPPNSGKNYFWDTIAAIATNVGHIGRVSNKCNQFSLQDAYNRRLVMGNELSMEDSAKEDFKKLCEGAAFNIRVKFQGDKIFSRTPVCFITNGVLEISQDPHFKNVRLIPIRWGTCNLLAASKMKPYPLALFDVFDYFNVSVE